MTIDADLDLLVRRRIETAEQIHRAALDLFEAQGLRETTVQQIAQRAGVSPRTFFRYFAVKERAAFPAQGRVFAMVDAVRLDAGVADAAAAFDAVASAIEGFLAVDAPQGESQRVALLITREPELETFVGTQDGELAVRIRTRLAEIAPRLTSVELHMVAAGVIALWRATWDLWGSAVRAGAPSTPADIFRTARTALSRTVT